MKNFKDNINVRKTYNNFDNKKSTNNNLINNHEFLQRLYKYNFDLEDILKFWIENMKNIVKRKEDIQNLNPNKSEEAENNELNKAVKKINKKEIGVKYDYKKPEENIKKLIPLCNDIFTISKNDE